MVQCTISLTSTINRGIPIMLQRSKQRVWVLPAYGLKPHAFILNDRAQPGDARTSTP
jgi:hypothetical protein